MNNSYQKQFTHLALYSLLLALSLAGTNAKAAENTPPTRASQESSDKGFSSWDIQALYSSDFHEPGINQDVGKFTSTLENSASWRWGSSYFFTDYLRSNSIEEHAVEFYGEWYPSASIAKIFDIDREKCFLKDVLITMGVNAGSKSTGATPLVYLPGVTLDFKIPGFQFFSVGTYAYLDHGRINGQGNGCNASSYQITPSWSVPFEIDIMRFRFDGFVDFIGSHGECSSQVVAQPTIKLDLGNFAGKPDRLLAGVEWAYWRNKYGIKDLDQTAPQAVVMWVF